MSTNNSPTAKYKPRKVLNNFLDQNYAETVYRTITGTDGKVTNKFTGILKELQIFTKDI
jgi:hypothetical protein